jgi:CcmD family protein
MRLIRIVTLVWTVCLALPDAAEAWQPQPPQPAQEEFVPLDQLPREAEMPAAPMVIAAYAFVWAAFLVYVFSMVKRVKKLEADLRTLEQNRR